MFLPRNTDPRCQTVVWFPGSDKYLSRTSESRASAYLFDVVSRSGRALVYSVCKGIDKRHVLLEGGRLPPDRRELISEVLHWRSYHIGPLQ